MRLHLQWTSEKYRQVLWKESLPYSVSVSMTKDYCVNPGPYEGSIVLGFGSLGPAEIEKGIKRLHTFVREFH